MFQKTSDKDSSRTKSYLKANTRNQSDIDTQDRILRQLDEKRQSFNMHYMNNHRSDPNNITKFEAKDSHTKSNENLRKDYKYKSGTSYRVNFLLRVLI